MSSQNGVQKRFLQLTEVSEVLNISSAQEYALVRSGELPAIKVGGRGQWRVETEVYLGLPPRPDRKAEVSTLMTHTQRAVVPALEGARR